MVATYTVKEDALVLDKPRVWSEKKLLNTVSTVRNYDLAPDGTRVAVLVPIEATEEQKANHHIVFLANFFDELRRRVPVH
jgi:hypothetical protein